MGMDPDLDPSGGGHSDLDPESYRMPEYDSGLRDARSMRFIQSLGPNAPQYVQSLQPDGMHSMQTRPELQQASAAVPGLQSYDLPLLKNWMYDYESFGSGKFTTKPRNVLPLLGMAAAVLAGIILLKKVK